MDNNDETMPVRRLLLANLRELLEERATHLDEWLDELVKAQVVNVTDEFGEVCSNQLKDFLFELHGDIDDWARTLARLLGEGE